MGDVLFKKNIGKSSYDGRETLIINACESTNNCSDFKFIEHKPDRYKPFKAMNDFNNVVAVKPYRVSSGQYIETNYHLGKIGLLGLKPEDGNSDTAHYMEGKIASSGEPCMVQTGFYIDSDGFIFSDFHYTEAKTMVVVSSIYSFYNHLGMMQKT